MKSRVGVEFFRAIFITPDIYEKINSQWSIKIIKQSLRKDIAQQRGVNIFLACKKFVSLNINDHRESTCHPIFPRIFAWLSTKQTILLYSWRFSRYNAPIHWLVHCHMTSNNKTVSRQMPRAGNIAKTVASKGKQFTLYPRNVGPCCTWSDLAWCCRWNLSEFFKIYFCFALLYSKSLNDWSLGEQWILFLSNLNVSLDFVSGDFEILGKQNSLFPSGPVIKC